MKGGADSAKIPTYAAIPSVFDFGIYVWGVSYTTGSFWVPVICRAPTTRICPPSMFRRPISKTRPEEHILFTCYWRRATRTLMPITTARA